MTDTSLRRVDPASPVPRRLTRPRWLDARLIGGVVLVLVSVLLGSLLVSSADHRQPVWSLSRDVAAGTVLTGADLRPVRVQLGPPHPGTWAPTSRLPVAPCATRCAPANCSRWPR